jgi:hypothetical protein
MKTGWAILLVSLAVAIFWLGMALIGAQARDLGQWEATDPAVREWYQSLMQPDVPNASCCGEADAYWCDITKTESVGHAPPKNFCIITDDRPDPPLMRPHIDVGTEIEIPSNKMKWDRSNPTGHNIVFVNRSGYVFCFILGTGI